MKLPNARYVTPTAIARVSRLRMEMTTAFFWWSFFGKMALMIQTAGTPRKNRPWIIGPNAPDNAVVLNAKHLTNPYNRIEAGDPSTHIDRVIHFLCEANADKVKRLVDKGRAAILSNRPVVVVCLFGKDRSRAIARIIGGSFDPGKVYYVHRESP